MATHNGTRKSAAPAAPDSLHNAADLRAAVRSMDSLSQEALSEISAVACIALRSLETPAGCVAIDDIARVLGLIAAKAQCLQNDINCIAEGVACNFVDETERRRWDAIRGATATRSSRGQHAKLTA